MVLPVARRALLAAAARTRVVPRTAVKAFSTTPIRRETEIVENGRKLNIKTFAEIKSEADLLPPGAEPGTIATDLEQATGLERLELLGKMEGIDIFDMKPLDASRRGTLTDPIVVESMGEEQYLGCTGCPADSHQTIWLTVSKNRPIERCPECGSVYKMDYVGPEEDHHHDHDHGHGHGEPHFPPQEDVKTIADYVKPEYW